MYVVWIIYVNVQDNEHNNARHYIVCIHLWCLFLYLHILNSISLVVILLCTPHTHTHTHKHACTHSLSRNPLGDKGIKTLPGGIKNCNGFKELEWVTLNKCHVKSTEMTEHYQRLEVKHTIHKLLHKSMSTSMVNTELHSKGGAIELHAFSMCKWPVLWLSPVSLWK